MKRSTTNKGVQIGPLSTNSIKARHFVPTAVSFPTPNRVHNALMPGGSLDLKQLWSSPVRSGGEQHKKCSSVGGC
jgi:hypothetical protein